MLDSGRLLEVEQVIRNVIEEEVSPRFCHLSDHEIQEKGPGDLVTVADVAAEDALARRLTSLLHGSVVVGEEAVAYDPEILSLLETSDPAWVIDPIDGTRNFVAGNPRFATLVALVQRGKTLASWTFAPALGVMAVAVAGQGAYIDGRQVRVRSADATVQNLDVSVPPSRWWSAHQRVQFDSLASHEIMLHPFDASGLEYVELARGRRSAMILTWEHPWDHAAGLLLHAEAGGVALTRDGRPFSLVGGNALPLIAGPDVDCVTRLHAALERCDGC